MIRSSLGMFSVTYSNRPSSWPSFSLRMKGSWRNGLRVEGITQLVAYLCCCWLTNASIPSWIAISGSRRTSAPMTGTN